MWQGSCQAWMGTWSERRTQSSRQSTIQSCERVLNSLDMDIYYHSNEMDNGPNIIVHLVLNGAFW